jgi:transposase
LTTEVVSERCFRCRVGVPDSLPDLMREDAPQRDYSLRDVFDAVRYVVKTGCQWGFLPHDFPPWTAVNQQARQWIAAGVFEEITHDLRMNLRLVDEREAQLRRPFSTVARCNRKASRVRCHRRRSWAGGS